MLQTRRSAANLFLRPYRLQWRGYADSGPPDPTIPNRRTDDKPVSEPTKGDSSHTESAHAASAGHYEPTDHDAHPAPVNESLGRGFYATIAILVSSFALYKYSLPSGAGDPNEQPLITRYIQKFDYLQGDFERKNLAHTKAIEEAAHERNLFGGSRASRHIDLRFPEVFNTGSPRNIPAGSQANLDELRAFYHQKNEEAEAARVERMKKAAERM